MGTVTANNMFSSKEQSSYPSKADTHIIIRPKTNASAAMEQTEFVYTSRRYACFVARSKILNEIWLLFAEMTY